MNEITVYWHHDQSVWFETLFKHIVLVQMECPDAVILLTTQLCHARMILWLSCFVL